MTRLITKPQILFAPMLSTFGGGSARGFGGGGAAGGGGEPFDFTFLGHNTYTTEGSLRIAPTKTQLLARYDTSTYPWLNDTSIYNVSSGVQTYVIQEDGNYKITAKGAPTYIDSSWSNTTQGRGAVMQATFTLTASTTLKILVGQRGEPFLTSYGTPSPSGNRTSGGSGASAVWITDSSTHYPLIIAGGASGLGIRNDTATVAPSGIGMDAHTGLYGYTSANAGTGTSPPSSDGYNGGINGDGGESHDDGAQTQGAGGGAGFRGNGSGYSSMGIDGGSEISTSGVGGNTTSNADYYPGGRGGFGGGGGTLFYRNSNGYSGGGGGYSGGASGEYVESISGYGQFRAGGGGGSFIGDGVTNIYSTVSNSGGTSDGNFANSTTADVEYTGTVTNLNEWNTGAVSGSVRIEAV